MKLLGAIYITAFIFILSSASVFASTKGLVNSDRVNVRQGASTSSPILDKLGISSIIEISGLKDDFYEIALNGQKAYIYMEFVGIVETTATINNSGVKVMAEANTDSEVLGFLNRGEKIVANGFAEEWIRVVYRGKDAYIEAHYAAGAYLEDLPYFSEDIHAVVYTDSSLNVRQSPSTDANVLSTLHNGSILDVLSDDGEWVLVETNTGIMGFVRSEFVQIVAGPKPGPPVSAKGQEIVSYAKQFLGSPYASGGTSPTRGFDCSGFVYTVYRNFNITLNRSSRGMASNGIEVSRAHLTAGDLVLFTNGGKNIGHVGIYIGDGQYIHSSTYGVGVIISDLNSRNSSRSFVTARRIIS